MDIQAPSILEFHTIQYNSISIHLNLYDIATYEYIQCSKIIIVKNNKNNNIHNNHNNNIEESN